jgi:hypothetical protein
LALATNIVRRPGSSRYYLRASVPVDLQPLLKKGERWKSLGTSDPKEARIRGHVLQAEWEREFDEWRRKRVPTDADIRDAVWTLYQSELEEDRAARVQGGGTGLPNGFRALQATDLRKHLAIGETALIQWAADDYIARKQLLIEPGSAAYKDLCHRLQRAMLEALTRADERDQGEWSGKPKDELVQPPAQSATDRMAAPGETIMELFDRFKAEKRGAISADTWDQNRKIVQLFAEFVGETAHVSAVSRKSVRDWKHKLASWPVKAGEIKAFAGMSFRKAIEANATIGKERHVLRARPVRRSVDRGGDGPASRPCLSAGRRWLQRARARSSRVSAATRSGERLDARQHFPRRADPRCVTASEWRPRIHQSR